MAKRLKLRFPRFIASFQSLQICRSRDPSNLPEVPSPAIYRVSTVNQRALDTVYPPKVLAPPSTPEQYPLHKRRVSAKLISVGCSPQSSPVHTWKKEAQRSTAVAGRHESKTRRKNHIPDIKPAVSKTEREKNKGIVRTSIPLGDCSWCSDVDEESEALLSFSRSFSKDMSLEFLCSEEKAREESKKNSEMENVKKARRLRRYALKTESTTAGSNASVLRRMATCTANGKVRESFAVVKRTEEPYEEFKRSMMEMILEKQILGAEELQELLQCFLTLNSRLYHGVIVEAFCDIWEVLFCDSPWGHRASVGF
ncbi:transcription repressor OFP7-like [Juglans microcarpa x Juglans regia]|uniref:transcription repressor OFP7-like n=1 Tax=Juglans microcarpa x Juglans regia TaxID=2249226 RepID=UPI001B7E8D26|nr:transcription repressor OFP7-like [Juglans microcarpa x Juglans regia]